MKVTLTRFADSPFGVFGSFSLKDGATVYTVEPPWMDNRPNVSCIPCGDYTCRPQRYRRGGYDAVEVTDVPGRSHILFHRGNRMKNTRGCILVTSDLGCLYGQWAGLSSRTAFAAFMEDYGADEFNLVIDWAPPMVLVEHARHQPINHT